MTVAEILVDSIHKTFTLFQKLGCLKIKKVSKPLIDFFNKVLQQGASDCIKGIVKINKIQMASMCEDEIAKTIGCCMKKKNTIIPVIKKGVTMTKVIDDEQNEKFVNGIQFMTEKSTCYDIFYNAKIDGKRIMQKVPLEK